MTLREEWLVILVIKQVLWWSKVLFALLLNFWQRAIVERLEVPMVLSLLRWCASIVREAYILVAFARARICTEAIMAATLDVSGEVAVVPLGLSQLFLKIYHVLLIWLLRSQAEVVVILRHLWPGRSRSSTWLGLLACLWANTISLQGLWFPVVSWVLDNIKGKRTLVTRIHDQPRLLLQEWFEELLTVANNRLVFLTDMFD